MPEKRGSPRVPPGTRRRVTWKSQRSTLMVLSVAVTLSGRVTMPDGSVAEAPRARGGLAGSKRRRSEKERSTCGAGGSVNAS